MSSGDQCRRQSSNPSCIGGSGIAYCRFTMSQSDAVVKGKALRRQGVRLGRQGSDFYPVSGMIGGPESNFRFTEEGWSRREEWIALPAGSP
jgi:hypothetical protein